MAKHSIRIQFGLRALFCVTGLIALVTGWLSWEWRRVQQESDAVARLEAQGGQVLFDFDFVSSSSEKSRPRTIYSKLFPSVCWVGLRNDPRVKDETVGILGRLANVKALDIEYVNVTDDALQAAINCSNIEELRVIGTGTVTDKGIAAISKMRGLKVLGLSETGISDSLLCEVVKLPHLEVLYLTDMAIDDSVLAQAAKASQLHKIVLDNSNITDDGVIALVNSQSLKSISLAYTRVSDRALFAISKSSSLTMLNLEGTKVTSHGIKMLRGMPHLKRLALYDTALESASINALRIELPDCEIEG